MWNPFRKKSEEKSSSFRIDIEDLLEQGYTCKEVAEELGITQEEVYRVKSARLRREWRGKTGIERKPVEENDKISQLKEELVSVELQDRIDEAKHKAFLRQREREEFEREDTEELIEEESPDKLLNTLFLNILMKQHGGNTVSTVVPAPLPPQHQEKVFSIPSPVVDFQKIKAGIKGGFVTKEKFIEEMSKTGFSDEDSDKIYDFIKKKL